jgi:hypothetical protein
VDDIHILFSGGWNSNPTPRQFAATFRKLMAHCGACPSGATGNSVAQETLDLVRAGTKTYIPPDFQRSADRRLDNDDLEVVLANFGGIEDGLAGIVNPETQSSVIDNIIVYISGFVVRRVYKSVSCLPCKSQLISMSPDLRSNYLLLTMKNRGGLIVPSSAVVDVQTVAEKFIRQNTAIRKLSRDSATVRHRVVSGVLRYAVRKGFFVDDHDRTTRSGLESHSFDLVRKIVTCYFNLRAHHVTSLRHSDIQKSAVRNKTVRNLIFIGQ